MIFFAGSSEDSSKRRLLKKLKKKLKKKEYEAYCRRQHLIMEARKSHEKNRKDAAKYLAKGGYGYTASMEEENLGFAVAEGFNKSVAISAGAISKIKARKKSLDRSRKTHLDKLKKARAQMKKRGR